MEIKTPKPHDGKAYDLEFVRGRIEFLMECPEFDEVAFDSLLAMAEKLMGGFKQAGEQKKNNNHMKRNHYL